jgi:uncharacterized membrane protein (DUF2068 family)
MHSASVYVPFEVVELTQHLTWESLLMLAVNVSIVIVLWSERRSTA